MSQNDATRVIEVIDSRIATKTASGAGVEYTIGEVAGVSGTVASAYLYGESAYASEDFRLSNGLLPNVGDRVMVAIDKNRGGRWVEQVLPATANPVIALDVTGGRLLFGDGTDAPDAVLYRAGVSILKTDGEFQALVLKAPSVPTTGDVAVSVQTSGHATQDFYILGDGKMTWGDGTNVHDVSLYRLAANVLKTDDSLDVVGTLYLNRDAAVATGNATLAIKGSAVGHTADYIGLIYESSTSMVIQFGDGSGSGNRDVNLYRSAANVLATGDKFDPTSLNLQVKAGIPADGDITGGAASGDVVLDTTNSRIYFRVGTTWKYAALT